MNTRPTPARRLLAVITALLIGISGSVALAAPAVADTAATVTVTPSAEIDTTVATTLTVGGSGFVGLEPVTVALVSEAEWAANGAASIPLVSAQPTIVEGALEAALDVAAGTLDPAVAYGVATFAPTEREYDTFTALALVAPVEVAEAPVVEAPVAEIPVEAVPEAAARVAAPAGTVAPGNVTGGTAAWGLSTYLNSANMGRPNPLASAYVAPSTFDAATRTSTWGNTIGTVNADGSATLAYDGTTVNFAPTGGGWLRLGDLEATLDASGNGSITAVVEYGTAPGTYPNIAYDAALAPVRGPERVSLVTLSGNAIAPVRDASSATWSGLTGSWSAEFTAFLSGDSAAGIPAWAYATTVSATAGRTPLPFTLSAAVPPVATATVYDTGSASWGLSTYLNSANMGRPNPLPTAYVAPSTFDAVTRTSTWGGGTATVNHDGSATLAFRGTSVNFAPTGGGWLTLTDVQATLDAAGNGAVTAVAAYGTAPGTYPNIAFDPAQAPTNGPTRVTLVNLSGNATPVAQTGTTATWANLTGSWSSEFTAFLAGSGVTTPWAYATTVSSAAGRTPLAFTFDLGIAPPPAVATTTTLTVSPTTEVVQGTAVTLTAAVAPAAAGSVQFRNGSTVLGSASVSAGSAALALPGLAVGSYGVTAVFTPTDAAAFVGSQSAVAQLTVTAPVVAQAGSLIWGVKSSLRSYVLGGGGISTSAGAGSYGSSFLFPQESSAAFDQASGLGTSAYRGAVTFSYPAHGFSIAISNPRAVVSSATTGSLVVDVTYNGVTTPGVTFATLFLGGAGKSSSAGSTTFTGVPASLTTAGAAAFQGFYSAGDSLDPVTFVAGSPAASFTASSASAPAPRTAASTPPSTTGITLAPGTRLVAGGEVTVQADGFEPSEEGILVIIYSTPVVLDTNAKADASGRLTWTGRLPAGLTGSHTLTFQGSVNRGIPVDIAPQLTTAASGCPVDGATITWGFKESFRSYISGSIANGEWVVADGATYETPSFGWSAGTGAYDADGGLVAFPGSVTFTGHGGILNTTVSNPQLRFIDADSAVLLLDVSGTTQDGAAVSQAAVEFVEIDLAAATAQADGSLTVADAPTTLTAAGSSAFGTYEAGEPFDPISFVLPLDADCGTPIPADERTSTVTAAPVSSTADLGWLWIVLGAVLLLIVAAVIVIVARRRRTA